MSNTFAERILASRQVLMANISAVENTGKSPEAAEGGCGVLGFCASLPLAGQHVLAASRQMHNRGNGKGGGIAMVGLDPQQARVDEATLNSHYLLQIALLDASARSEVEKEFIEPCFEIAQAYPLAHIDDYRLIPDLEVCPPDVWRYFVRVKPGVLDQFAAQKNLVGLPLRALEDEFVYQNSYRLNLRFYASLGEKRAFVLSHGRNLSVLKIVGYAEDVVAYYQLADQTAHVWVAHQRYPTKGRVWHPGGAHPFIGLNEALVHNGDFANYHAVSEYLRQRNIGQLFLTDTEVSVQLFDLWERVYGYPLEVTLEAMAPTTEYDFFMLTPEKQELYRLVQRAHMHGSPDGPWFFILARSLADQPRFELLGITDTSMLRPQVFALYEHKADNGEQVQIGLIASERQAINACLRSLAAQDERFQPVADHYWVARGGSHTDGGSFRFSYTPQEGLTAMDKFGSQVQLPAGKQQVRISQLDPHGASQTLVREWQNQALHAYDNGGVLSFWHWLKPAMADIGWNELGWGLGWLNEFAQAGTGEWRFVWRTLDLLRDQHYPTGNKKRASILALVDRAHVQLFDAVRLINGNGLFSGSSDARRVSWDVRHAVRPPRSAENLLLIDTLGFPPEGDQSAARLIATASRQGWQQIIAYNWQGGRFAASGLGSESQGLRLDLYGDVGDYAASGLDGAEVHIHGDGQDQLGQILKTGKLVVHGDVGQTFLYGAKGGEIYVRGSAAGRPLINAVGRPRAVINGTCLDYLAESFMAGDPLNGGGFVILNGVTFDLDGNLSELPNPYPGGNLFSLASGGAIYVRDPDHHVSAEQLNGGRFTELTEKDWELIEPYLRENERLFEIRLRDLLTVGGEARAPWQVYRKVTVADSGVLKESHNR
ncbi:MAG: hypothetical protein JSV61_05280 [Anaerolineales bacterium]|nr:MAG: hypothetical protein JSV61_05280 [Anaerolineales bacterium]